MSIMIYIWKSTDEISTLRDLDNIGELSSSLIKLAVIVRSFDLSISFGVPPIYSTQNLTDTITTLHNIKNVLLTGNSDSNCRHTIMADKSAIKYSTYSNDTITMETTTLYDFTDTIENAVLFI